MASEVELRGGLGLEKVLTASYEQACRFAGNKRILRAARRGERDVEKLTECALAGLAGGIADTVQTVQHGFAPAREPTEPQKMLRFVGHRTDRSISRLYAQNGACESAKKFHPHKWRART